MGIPKKKTTNDHIEPVAVCIEKPKEPEPETRKYEDPMPRNMKITSDLLDKHGYTDTCSKCGAMIKGRVLLQAHDATCRKRIETSVKEDVKYKDRYEASKRRLDEATANEGERLMEKRPRPDPVGGGGVPAQAERYFVHEHPATATSWNDHKVAGFIKKMK